MDKKELLFYDAYEAFYAMAKTSRAFRAFCQDAFGADFSQDGFSNIEQINMILHHIPLGNQVRILDIGCGNGKMLGYLQERRDARSTALTIRRKRSGLPALLSGTVPISAKASSAKSNTPPKASM